MDAAARGAFLSLTISQATTLVIQGDRSFQSPLEV
jgi:hypothetical protein